MKLTTRSVVMAFCAVITIASIAATAILTPTDHVSQSGSFISTAVATHSNFVSEQIFGADQLRIITSQRGYAALRVYYNCDNICVVGTDSEGNDLEKVLSFGMQEVGNRSLVKERLVGN